MKNIEIIEFIIKNEGDCANISCSDCPLQKYRKEGNHVCSVVKNKIKSWAIEILRKLKIKEILK